MIAGVNSLIYLSFMTVDSRRASKKASHRSALLIGHWTSYAKTMAPLGSATH
jgi:hypothetical protein